jgi:hypothetical protein
MLEASTNLSADSERYDLADSMGDAQINLYS